MAAKRGASIWLNLLGILSAFAIAVGGWLLVQGGLSIEEKKLLSGSGVVEGYRGESVESELSSAVIFPESLTEEELVQVICALEEGADILPHEPGRNQLSMAEAILCGRNWMEQFLAPHLGISDITFEEYRIGCYLWRPETDAGKTGNGKSDADGGDVGESPWLSCWTVSFSSSRLEAQLILNAVSGQVLDAAVSCAAPVEYLDEEQLMALLGDYAVSFGLEEDYVLVYSGETESGAGRLPWYQSIGTQRLFAAVYTGGTAVLGTDAGYFVHLYLVRELQPDFHIRKIRAYAILRLPAHPHFAHLGVDCSRTGGNILQLRHMSDTSL